MYSARVRTNHVTHAVDGLTPGEAQMFRNLQIQWENDDGEPVWWNAEVIGYRRFPREVGVGLVGARLWVVRYERRPITLDDVVTGWENESVFLVLFDFTLRLAIHPFTRGGDRFSLYRDNVCPFRVNEPEPNPDQDQEGEHESNVTSDPQSEE